MSAKNSWRNFYCFPDWNVSLFCILWTNNLPTLRSKRWLPKQVNRNRVVLNSYQIILNELNLHGKLLLSQKIFTTWYQLNNLCWLAPNINEKVYVILLRRYTCVSDTGYEIINRTLHRKRIDKAFVWVL